MSGTVKLTEIMREKDKRIAELEALYSAATDVMKERGNKILELEIERKRLKHEIEVRCLYGNKTAICEEAVLAENQRLREALEWVANTIPGCGQDQFMIDKAKQALEKET